VSSQQTKHFKLYGKRSKSWNRFYFLALGFIIVLIFISVQFFSSTDFSPRKEFTIETGQGVKVIAANLEAAGIIRSRFWFESYVYLKGNESSFQAGFYSLEPTSIAGLVKIFTSGRDADERTITIPEGWNLRNIAFYFENEGMFQAEELWEITGLPAQLASDVLPKDFSSEFITLTGKPAKISLEGYLFPDTYRIFADSTMDDIVVKMLKNFQDKLRPELRAEIQNSGRDLHEIITMASIIEKEVREPEDLPIVSGLLWKRIDGGVPLQVDSSVNYVTGGSKPAVTLEETGIDSRYNTYLYPGLPPGPIANPGIAAIEAAIFPIESEYWFYLSKPDGETVFSRTLDEHNAAKQRYLK
jgi:UPF0755 protein